MSFELTNTTTMFMNLMHYVLRPFLYYFMVMFIDDILVYSPMI